MEEYKKQINKFIEDVITTAYKDFGILMFSDTVVHHEKPTKYNIGKKFLNGITCDHESILSFKPTDGTDSFFLVFNTYTGQYSIGIQAFNTMDDDGEFYFTNQKNALTAIQALSFFYKACVMAAVKNI